MKLGGATNPYEIASHGIDGKCRASQQGFRVALVRPEADCAPPGSIEIEPPGDIKLLALLRLGGDIDPSVFPAGIISGIRVKDGSTVAIHLQPVLVLRRVPCKIPAGQNTGVKRTRRPGKVVVGKDLSRTGGFLRLGGQCQVEQDDPDQGEVIIHKIFSWVRRMSVRVRRRFPQTVFLPNFLRSNKHVPPTKTRPIAAGSGTTETVKLSTTPGLAVPELF